MVVFGEVGFFDLLRAALAVLTAGFLPGLFLYAALRKSKNPLELVRKEFFETLAVSLISSMILLSLLSMLLTFTIGFSQTAIAVAEAALIIGCWKIWKIWKKKSE